MKKLSTLLVAPLAISGAILATNVLAYQPNTGAGQTTQPSMQYQRQLAEQQRQKSTSYYQPAPPKSNYGQYGHADRTMGSLGFAPNVIVRPSSTPTTPAPTAAQIGSRLIESNPKWGPYVAGAAATSFVASGLANSVMAGGSVASAIAQPATAPAALPSAALRSGMAANSFRSACKAGAWLDYAARVQQQQACLPYPGMK